MAKYQEIADSLRTRIQSGEFSVGERLPSISSLQDEYGVPGLNTIRVAQQLLVDEGMLETRQGVGAFVISTVSLAQYDVVDALTRARDTLTTAISALRAKKHTVAFDLLDDEVGFVLTDALRDYAARERAEADDDPDRPNSSTHRRWAEVAEAMLDRIDSAG